MEDTINNGSTRHYKPPFRFGMGGSHWEMNSQWLPIKIVCVTKNAPNRPNGTPRSMSSRLLRSEAFYRTAHSVALAARVHRFHGVVEGRPRREVVQVHAEHRR